MEQYTQKYTEKSLISGNVGKILVAWYFYSVDKLLSKIDIDKNKNLNVLEVGCGAGHSTQRLLKILPKNIQFTASDIEEENLDEARELVGEDINFIKEDIYNLDRENNSVDLIFVLEVLEHLEDPKRALKEIKRVTKQYAVVAVPREPIWRMLNMVRFKYLKDLGNTPGHIQHWSSISFKKLLKDNGFKIVKAQYPLPWTMLLVKKEV